MLGAAPAKAAALVTFLPLVVAALLVTGTSGLALASGTLGLGGQVLRLWSRLMGCLARSGVREQAAGKLKPSPRNYDMLTVVLQGPT